jgi:tetratricopeptide (TPR) repeat protein
MTDVNAAPVLAAAYLLHSPMLREQRRESVRLIDERVAPAVRGGVIQRIESDEAQDVVNDVAQLVDVDPARVPEALAEFRPLVRNMQVRQLSNAMKHYRALQRAAAGPAASDFSLVVEDDSLFSDAVIDGLRNTVRCAPADVDIVFLSLPSPTPPPADSKSVAFDDAVNLFGLLPACDAYLVRGSAAAKLAGAFLPIRFATNVQLTYLVKSLGLRAVVAVPNTFVDGSKLGVFPCSLDANSRLLWNRVFCKMEACVKGAKYGPEEAAEFDRALGEQPFKEHPDVLALRALHLQRLGRHAEAESAYSKALEALDKAGCVVNNASEVLRNYISLYKHLQCA